MRNWFLIIMIFQVVFCTSCLDDNSGENDDVEVCDVTLANTKLNDSSLNFIPYDGKKSIVFRDSFGHETYFMILSKTRLTNQVQSTLYKLGGNNPKDTVKYCFKPDLLKYELNSIELNIKMSVELYTRPYFTEPSTGFYADVLDINITNPLDKNKLIQIFNKVVDQRSVPVNESKNILKDEMAFFGQLFKNVEKTDFENSRYNLWYSIESGIVAFNDHEGVKWRFVRFE